MTRIESIFCFFFCIYSINANPWTRNQDYPGHIKYEYNIDSKHHPGDRFNMYVDMGENEEEPNVLFNVSIYSRQFTLLQTIADKTDKDVEHLFRRFVKDYNRSYTPYDKDFLVYQIGEMLLRKSLQGERQVNLYEEPIMPQNATLPKNFDWRDKGAVSSVKNQGMCGSCWAFSVIGNIEGQWAVKTQQLLNLSVQELVDCDLEDQGCNGGLPDQAYAAIERLGGLDLEADYPYHGRRESCEINDDKIAVKVADWRKLPSNETELAYWLMKRGPISVAMDANTLMFYMGGIFHPWRILCNTYFINHAVLLIGFGEDEDGRKYWIVKNSWGPSWGEQGYFRIFRGDGTCGINTYATTAFVQ